MYRSETWSDGYYMDNHEKYECFNCEKTFIVGKELLNRSNKSNPICPYCGSKSTELVSSTENDQLEELSLYMGCLGIYIDEEQVGD